MLNFFLLTYADIKEGKLIFKKPVWGLCLEAHLMA